MGAGTQRDLIIRESFFFQRKQPKFARTQESSRTKVRGTFDWSLGPGIVQYWTKIASSVLGGVNNDITPVPSANS